MKASQTDLQIDKLAREMLVESIKQLKNKLKNGFLNPSSLKKSIIDYFESSPSSYDELVERELVSNTLRDLAEHYSVRSKRDPEWR